MRYYVQEPAKAPVKAPAKAPVMAYNISLRMTSNVEHTKTYTFLEGKILLFQLHSWSH